AKTPRASSASKRVAPRGEIARGPELAVGRRARAATSLPIRAAADAHAADEAATAIAPEDEVEIERSRGALALHEERTLHEAGWDLEQEPRRDRQLAHPAEDAARRVGQIAA